jgi:hypothetical protein
MSTRLNVMPLPALADAGTADGIVYGTLFGEITHDVQPIDVPAPLRR